MAGSGDRSRSGEESGEAGEELRPLTLEAVVSEGELETITRAAELYDMPIGEFVKCCALATAYSVDHPAAVENMLDWMVATCGPAEA